MRNAYIREVYANLCAQKLHDDRERQIAGMDYARRALLTKSARMSNVCVKAQRSEPG
jgi:hypothetical protein